MADRQRARGVLSFESTHRSQSGLDPPMICLDRGMAYRSIVCRAPGSSYQVAMNAPMTQAGFSGANRTTGTRITLEVAVDHPPTPELSGTSSDGRPAHDASAATSPD
jgi:hypothetical protein